MKFEWDEAKAKSNREKHGVDFLDAAAVFSDEFRTELVDTRRDYGEDRYVVVGMSQGGRLLTVTYTERAGRTRIISARPATRREEQEYYGHRY